jgi:hypothetical protein
MIKVLTNMCTRFYIILIVYVLLLTACINKAIAQKISVGIAFCGDMKGETIKSNGTLTNFKNMLGENPNVDYTGIGPQDSLSVRTAIDNAGFRIKTRGSFRYRKANFKIPSGFAKYLIFTRNRSLEKGQYFTIRWSNQYPYADPQKDVKELFMQDTAVHKLPVPRLSIEIDNKPLTADLLRSINPSPNQLLLFTFLLESPSSAIGASVEFKNLQIIYAKGDAPVNVSIHKGEFAIANSWPFGIIMDKGTMIVFNIIYDYRVNGEVIETSVMSTNIKF